jgi:hypothetical protein
MAEKKSKSASSVLKDSRRDGRTCAGSILTQAPVQRAENGTRSRRAQPTADELGLRAWKTTYENRRAKTK